MNVAVLLHVLAVVCAAVAALGAGGVFDGVNVLGFLCTAVALEAAAEVVHEV